MPNDNRQLHAAHRDKNDEFYTQLTDIEKELKHYRRHFAGKTVLCNCDDPRESNFCRFFMLKFEEYGLRKLICSCYKSDQPDLFSDRPCEHGCYYIYEGGGTTGQEGITVYPLKGSGDFRSEECVRLLDEADIVVTNPPFSLFREYVAQLMKKGKQFLIIGNQNAISYKEVFTHIMGNRIWLGVNSGDMKFRVPDYYEARSTRSWRDEDGNNWRSLGNACWYTNMDHAKRHESLILYKHYSPEEYPRYDNYDAIEVSRYVDIPCDYDGCMGVPVTFLSYYNPEQFEIVGEANHGSDSEFDLFMPVINGKSIFKRILVKEITHGDKGDKGQHKGADGRLL